MCVCPETNNDKGLVEVVVFGMTLEHMVGISITRRVILWIATARCANCTGKELPFPRTKFNFSYSGYIRRVKGIIKRRITKWCVRLGLPTVQVT